MATLESIEAQIDAFKDWADGKFGDIDSKLDNLIIESACPVCQGDGEVNSPVDGQPGPPYICPRCAGTGKTTIGELEEG